MKKIITILILTFVACFYSATEAFAFIELGSDNNNKGRSVDITLAEDYFTKYTVRNVEAIITDDGRFKQTYDTVNFYNIYGGKYNLSNLHVQGYRTMAVEITMDIKEYKDGYQYIFIYDNTAKETRLRGGQIEHVPGKKESEYRTYTFYLEIDISNVTDNLFVIRYGASGSDEDDWGNKEVKIQIGWSKDVLKTSNIWSLKKTSETSHTATKLPDAK